MFVGVAFIAALVLATGGVESAPCAADVTEMGVTSTAGVQDLVDALNCTGGGVFNVNWYGTVAVEQTIEVTGGSQLTVEQASNDSSGDDLDGVAVLDGGNLTGIFHVSGGSMLTLVELVITGGSSDLGGAVAAVSSSSLEMETNKVTAVDCVFMANIASIGGAIYSSNSTINIEGTSVFRSNSAIYGGAIFSTDSVVNIDDTTTFTSNSLVDYEGTGLASDPTLAANTTRKLASSSASDSGGDNTNDSAAPLDGDGVVVPSAAEQFAGGAVYLVDSEINIDGITTFTNNSANKRGGSIFSSDSKINIDGNTLFTDNYAGAIYTQLSTVRIAGTTTFTGNSQLNVGTFFEGGAMYLEESELSLDGNTVFTANTGAFGGAIYTQESIVATDGVSTFRKNSADDRGGAMSLLDSNLTINGVAVFMDNSAELSVGGAIHAKISAVIIDGNTSFTGNSAFEGGAISISHGSFTVVGSACFEENSGTSGGAVHAKFGGVYVDGKSSFTNNSATLGGGAIYTDSAEVGIDGSATFKNNTAGDYGGAIYSNNASVLSINGSATFTANTGDLGGALSSREVSQIDIHGNSTFTGNLAVSQGGAIYSSDFSQVNISGTSTFTNNGAADQGGAVYSLESSVVSVSGTTLFTGNFADSSGGAMSISSPGQLHVSAAIFATNTASFGGAIALTSSVEETRTFTGCIFEENQASDGGALYFYTSAGVEVIGSSVFRENYAAVSGGAVLYTGLLEVEDTIFVANEAVTEGLAIMSLGVLEDKSISNVSFAGNVPHCPASQYGYEEDIGNSSDSCRFELVCARCSTGCDAIPGGVFVEPQDTLPVCVDLPEGATAASSGTSLATLTLEEGYYRTSAESQIVLECYQEDACVGGTAGDDSCASGYKGPYCAVCTDGYAAGPSYSCTKCSGAIGRSASWLAAVILAVAVLIAIAAVTYLVCIVGEGGDGDGDEGGARRSLVRKWSSCRSVIVKALPLTGIKTVVVVWQIVTQFSAIAGEVYPEQYEEFISYLSPINLDIGALLSYACIVKTAFYDRLVIATVGPLLGLATLAGTYSIARRRNSNSEATVRTIRRKHISVALFVMFFIYSSVSFTIFQTFVCDKLDDGVTYLRADYSLTCTTAKHGVYRVYASVMVFVYPVGIPAFFAWWLVRNQHHLKKSDRESVTHLEPWGGLWAAYKPLLFYFEIVECARRIVLTGVAVFVLPDSAAQIAVVLLLAVVFLFISESSCPFASRVDMVLYRWGNGIVLASMYAALLLKVDVSNEDSGSQTAFVGVLIAANIFMVLTVVVQSFLMVSEYRASQAPVEVVNPIGRCASSLCVQGVDASYITGTEHDGVSST